MAAVALSVRFGSNRLFGRELQGVDHIPDIVDPLSGRISRVAVFDAVLPSDKCFFLGSAGEILPKRCK